MSSYISRSNFEEQQLAKVALSPVQVLPSYFEKYTSFQSLHSPEKIFEQLVEALKRLSSTTWELLGSRQQIHGSFCEKHNLIKFQVNLFKKDRDCYIVEVQRASGDSSAFNNFFLKLKKELANAPDCILHERPVFESKVDEEDDDELSRPPSHNVTLDQSSLNPLKTMAESKYVDVAREGMKMLAQLSVFPQNLPLLSSQCRVLFQSLLSSPDEDLARYSGFILAKLE